MRLKEVDGKLVPPPAVYTTEDGKTIFNMAASPELCDQYGWLDRSQEWIDQWHKDHPEPEPPVTLDQLTELTYQAKCDVAYGGLTFIKDGVSYNFDTNHDSISMCNGQILAMQEQPADFPVSWKVYINGYPSMLQMTKQEFIKVYGYGMLMINNAFITEGQLNAAYAELTTEEVAALDLEEERTKIQEEFSKIQRVFEV